MRGSYPMRATTMPARIAASQRRNGIGRCIEIHAVPSDISASAIVSQPFSSAKVSASAMAASVPVANSAIEIGNPGRCSRLLKLSVAAPNAAASTTARIANGIERSRCAMRAYSAISSASGVNTAQADHTTGTMALTERPCARNPAAPKPTAKIAADIRCTETEPSVAFGPMPGSGPPGSTSMSGLPRTAHSANTMKTNAAAATIAPVAASVRHATNKVPATSNANTIMAVSA